jgi:YegS/Rv2252/BmrU family lipid kinase
MANSEGYISYIINPKSGASSNKRLVSCLQDYFNSIGRETRVSFTESLSHACELANQAAVDYQCTLVAAAGGDGTIREVIHGLEGSDKPLLIIPCGTENLLANELGFDLRPQTLILAYEAGQTRPLDLGVVNGKCFTSICGFGFDGDVINRLHQWRTGHINHLDYFWPIWRSFWEYRFPPMRVTLDGEEFFSGRGLVFVGNISRYAIGLQICKHAQYGDGKLDLCIYSCRNQARLLRHAAMTVAKLHTKSRDVLYKQGTAITVEPLEETIYCQIDGDPGPTGSASIQLIPKAIRVLVPPGAKPAGIRTRLMRMIG